MVQDEERTGSQEIDLRATGSLPAEAMALRSDVHRLAAQVEQEVQRLAPLLAEAMDVLCEVDRQVCAYADAVPGQEDVRYEFAAGLSGHDRLYDALQRLSARADVYSATESAHPAAMRSATSGW